MNLDNKQQYEKLKALQKENRNKKLLLLISIIMVAMLGCTVAANTSIEDDIIFYIVLIIVVPLFISRIYYSRKASKYENEANKYCPYCYAKDFTTTTLSTNKIRSYVKEREYTDSNGKEKIQKTLIEDWEGQYKHNCCGHTYTKTWDHKIELNE